ncbi:hypothetical protein [Pseudomonas sp. NPDC089406]
MNSSKGGQADMLRMLMRWLFLAVGSLIFLLYPPRLGEFFAQGV